MEYTSGNASLVISFRTDSGSMKKKALLVINAKFNLRAPKELG